VTFAPGGLSGREAVRRLEVSGPDELVRRGGRRWPRELARQFTHPLAPRLAAAAALPFIVWRADEIRRWLVRRRSS
jgi:hypothetical protein